MRTSNPPKVAAVSGTSGPGGGSVSFIASSSGTVRSNHNARNGGCRRKLSGTTASTAGSSKRRKRRVSASGPNVKSSSRNQIHWAPSATASSMSPLRLVAGEHPRPVRITTRGGRLSSLTHAQKEDHRPCTAQGMAINTSQGSAKRDPGCALDAPQPTRRQERDAVADRGREGRHIGGRRVAVEAGGIRDGVRRRRIGVDRDFHTIGGCPGGGGQRHGRRGRLVQENDRVRGRRH